MNSMRLPYDAPECFFQKESFDFSNERSHTQELNFQLILLQPVRHLGAK